MSPLARALAGRVRSASLESGKGRWQGPLSRYHTCARERGRAILVPGLVSRRRRGLVLRASPKGLRGHAITAVAASRRSAVLRPVFGREVAGCAAAAGGRRTPAPRRPAHRKSIEPASQLAPGGGAGEVRAVRVATPGGWVGERGGRCAGSQLRDVHFCRGSNNGGGLLWRHFCGFRASLSASLGSSRRARPGTREIGTVSVEAGAHRHGGCRQIAARRS